MILYIAVFGLTHTQDNNAVTVVQGHGIFTVKLWVKWYLGQIRLSQYVHLVSLFLKVALSPHPFLGPTINVSVVLESVN